MTNNQEKLLRGKLTKWLEAKGNSPGDVEQKANAWLQYFDGIKKPVVMLAACTWLCSGAVILPEDMPKVEQAVWMAELNRVDPLRYDRPMAIIDEFGAIELKEMPIDPDTVPTLHLNRRFDSGLAVYDVDESEESRENMRKVINTHFGKESNPWCLLQGDGKGNLTEESREYWAYYSAYPKQVAFVDGKLTAFSANSWNERVWWDRMDRDRNVVVMNGRIKGDPLGRSADKLYDTENGSVIGYENIFRIRDRYFKEHYDSIETDVSSKCVVYLSPKDRKNFKGPFLIPDFVTEIGRVSFQKCEGLTEVYIPDSVTKIGMMAFSGCKNLVKVHISDSVKEIEQDAFEHCTNLSEVHIPDSVTKIADGVFKNCTNLKEVHIPNTVTYIGDRVIHFHDPHLDNTICSIENGVFYGCMGLTKVHIPDSVIEINPYAFAGCTSLSEVHIPDSVMYVGKCAFEHCTSLSEVHIPDSVMRILDNAFYGCSGLKEIRIPDSVTVIGGRTFEGCSSLREIHIPGGVTEIGARAFNGCSSLKEIHVSPTAPQSLLDRLREVAPDDCAIVRDLPEKDISALRERGVSETAIRELQEKGSAHIHEKTFYRPSTEISPCQDSARTVFTNVVAVMENGAVRMKDPKSRADLGDVKSFFSGRKHVPVGIQNKPSADNGVKRKI